ncbi:SNAPC4 [Bugula neritina]|uniref:SNAPC4 n=1 Tax=Bugula neritina TaxID=10212 RepID=A0A7J7IZJ4_BUGNE|nr:SNAPC4 [Bugula neritina]
MPNTQYQLLNNNYSISTTQYQLLNINYSTKKAETRNTDRNTPEQKEILYTIDNVKSHFELSDVSVEDVISHADWLIIANTHLEGAFSTESCMNMYRNICNPVINRSLWSASEDVKLKELIQKHGHQSWSQVADELGTDRTPFICLQRYQQALNDYETAPWTQEREKTLCEYLDNYIGREDVISWDKVAWKVGEMTPNECKAGGKHGDVQKETVDSERRSVPLETALVSNIIILIMLLPEHSMYIVISHSQSSLDYIIHFAIRIDLRLLLLKIYEIVHPMSRMRNLAVTVVVLFVTGSG